MMQALACLLIIMVVIELKGVFTVDKSLATLLHCTARNAALG